MARIGSKRISEVLNFERDIKGKGLVRLRAGVGAGKNYRVRHLPEKYPGLQILMITSRKNTAQAEAFRLGTDNKIHTSKLFDTKDKELICDYQANLMVCTNAYIEHFFKNLYSEENSRTHLWNKFDVIFVDEAHSLTDDASFSDSVFYVERFLYHTRKLNPKCDIVLMTGTPEPIDWLFEEDAYSDHTDIDLYDQCIHLAPRYIVLVPQILVAEYLRQMWKKGNRCIYFANSVKRMAGLIVDLKRSGIPESDIGIAYTESENEVMLPPLLVEKKEYIREQIVKNSRLPQEVKIFITTSQNKEGVSIEDDDIKLMFAESHKKSDLEQMAGRIRGNPETGEGLFQLNIVHDAAAHPNFESYVNREADLILLDQIDSIFEKHKAETETAGEFYSKEKDISAVHKKCPYIRYDYISSSFSFYNGRDAAFRQKESNEEYFSTYLELYYERLGEWKYDIEADCEYEVTGGNRLNDGWFPYSQLRLMDDKKLPVERATLHLTTYLNENNLLGTVIDEHSQAMIMEEIIRIVQRYGAKALGFDRDMPKRLKPALKRFGLTIGRVSHKSTKKVITKISTPLCSVDE